MVGVRARVRVRVILHAPQPQPLPLAGVEGDEQVVGANPYPSPP